METQQSPTSQPPAPTPPQTALVPAAKREVRVVEDESPIAYLLDTARFEHTVRIASLMASAGLLPKHLRGENAEQTKANCFLVVNQAFRWKLDPFAVAPETYEVGGKLAYQGKLVAAVVNSRAGLADKLSYTFNGKTGDEMEVTVSGRFESEDLPRTVKLSVKQAKTANQMWTRDPEQKLIYSGAIRWARRHKPEVILGVLSDDEADEIRQEVRMLAMKPAKTPEATGLQQSQTTGKTPSAPSGAAAEPGKKPEPAKTTEKAKEPAKEAPKPALEGSGASTPAQEPSQPANVATAPSSEQGEGNKKLDDSGDVAGQAPREALGKPSDEKAEQEAGLAPLPPFQRDPKDTDEVASIKFLAYNAGITEPEIMVWAKSKGVNMAKEAQKTLSELSGTKLLNLAKAWGNNPAEFAKNIKAANNV